MKKLSDLGKYLEKNFIEDQSHCEHTDNGRKEIHSSEKSFEFDLTVEDQCHDQTQSDNTDDEQDCIFEVEEDRILKAGTLKCIYVVLESYELIVIRKSVPVSEAVVDTCCHRIDEKQQIKDGSRCGKEKHGNSTFIYGFLFFQMIHNLSVQKWLKGTKREGQCITGLPSWHYLLLRSIFFFTDSVGFCQ